MLTIGILLKRPTLTCKRTGQVIHCDVRHEVPLVAPSTQSDSESESRDSPATALPDVATDTEGDVEKSDDENKTSFGR